MLSSLPVPAAPESDDVVQNRIAGRLRERRADLRLTLEELALRSGVSRAMISKIERGEASPTATLLARLAHALGVSMASLFDGDGPAAPLLRRADQILWRDPATGYVRRNLSPRGFGAPMELVEIELPPGARVAFDNGYPEALHRFVWLIAGDLALSIGRESWTLAAGDCLHVRLDAPAAFHNPGAAPARYALATEAPR
jgi:transcriptional regulator with XRE-family HTH domain